MRLLNIKDACDEEINELKNIFFESSSVQSFESKDHEEAFVYKYFDSYRLNYPSLFFYIKRDTSILGYICGALDTKAMDYIEKFFPYYKNLDDKVLKKYPSHLICIKTLGAWVWEQSLLSTFVVN